jgi:hypothetical protein
MARVPAGSNFLAANVVVFQPAWKTPAAPPDIFVATAPGGLAISLVDLPRSIS